MKKNEKIEQKTSKPKMKWFSWMALLRIVVTLNFIATSAIIVFAVLFIRSYGQQLDNDSESWFHQQQEITTLKSQIECIRGGSNPESEACLKSVMNENIRTCFSDKIPEEGKVEECKKYNEASEKYDKLIESQIQSDE